MRINHVFNNVSRNEMPARSISSNKKVNGVDFESTKNLQVNETEFVSKSIVLDELDLDSIISKTQAENAMRQVKNTLVYKNEGFIATDNDTTLMGTNIVANGNIPHPDKSVDSIYDIPYSEIESISRQAMNACSFIDKDSMTKGELYNCIESVFKEYLGKDFLESHTVYGDQPTANMFFLMTLSKNGAAGTEDDNQIYIEAKGYTGMSEIEMRTDVRNKYPEVMTLKDCMLMSRELERLGLETTAYGGVARERILSTLERVNGENSNTPAFEKTSREIFDYMLKMPVNFENLKAGVEAFRGGDGRLHFTYEIKSSIDETLEGLFSLFGESEYGSDIIDKLIEML